MLYDKIDTDLISLGTPKKFKNEENKSITPVFYNGESLDFSLKNKYVQVEGIEENIYNKEYITIKSKQYGEFISDVCNKLGAFNPIQFDGSFRAVINDKSKIDKKLKNATFNACISLNIPTVYKDGDKTTVQVYVKDLVVIKIIEDLEIDFDKLELAI
ncbi:MULTISPECIES: hypothetical protein [Bacteria]|uniref:SsDNA binding protein-like protein n=1 Tax=Komagataella phaffii TaxID=460519 RepID=A0A1B2MJG2_9ASCO|nr:hypothetical protein [Corynebacterium amycolatum]AOA65367.1 GQ67_03004T0 [Komagataella phaffii]AOA70431.1 GQ67_p03004T0 [Komagataella phaffii GS115]AVX51676.1 ssDNA binding protein-like protein [Komagataella phaffii]MCQ9168425.1 hypothetical protein [Corynebacterium amycolatum]